MRVLVGGSSGAGKSTLARALAARLGCAHIELDALNWDPGWRNLSQEDVEEFRRRVSAASADDAWTCDGNYSVIRPVLLERATHLIWLNYPRRVIMTRVIGRSIARVIDQGELWAGTGNRGRLVSWLGKEHPIRWAWDTYARVQTTYRALFDDPTLGHIHRIRLRHPREAPALLDRLTREAGPMEPELAA